jgi:hypothetical protein
MSSRLFWKSAVVWLVHVRAEDGADPEDRLFQLGVRVPEIPRHPDGRRVRSVVPDVWS